MKSFTSPDYFEFTAPMKILSGKDALKNLGFDLVKRSVKRPLILTDPGIRKSGVLDKLLSVLRGSGIETQCIFSETPPDSSLKAVQKAARYYRAKECSGIIALGGGSVIDTAKGVRILLTEEVEELAPLAGMNRLKISGIPFFILPTTAGTGSEATQVAVISDPERGEKMLFISPSLFPDAAVLDPRMTSTLPPKLTAMTGMDALTHAVEAYTCLQKNPVSDALAFSAIRSIFGYLREAVENGKNTQARIELANASLLAGMAFSNSMVGAVHSIGHACGAVAHIPHGMAMSILLPVVMEANLQACGEFYGELLLAVSGPEAYASTPSKERAKKVIADIRALQTDLEEISGLPSLFSEEILSQKQFTEVAAYAVNDGSIICNPRDLSEAEILELLQKASR